MCCVVAAVLVVVVVVVVVIVVAVFSSFSCVLYRDRDAKGALGMLQSLRDSKTVAPDKLSYTLAIQVRCSAVPVSSPLPRGRDVLVRIFVFIIVVFTLNHYSYPTMSQLTQRPH